MTSSLTNNHGNSSMSIDRQILQVDRHQYIYLHFARCTCVPSHSLKSLVSFLTLVNVIHQWPVIQWFLFMLDLDTYIRMIRIVPSGFVAGEDYTLFLTTPSAVAETWLQIYECTTVPLSAFHIFHYLSVAVHDSISSCRNINSDLWVYHGSTFFLPHFPLFINSISDSSTSHYSSSSSYSRNIIYSYIFIRKPWHILHYSAAVVLIP